MAKTANEAVKVKARTKLSSELGELTLMRTKLNAAMEQAAKRSNEIMLELQKDDAR